MSMTVMYVILGSLILLSLLLYIVVHALNTKAKKNAMMSKAQKRAGAKRASDAEAQPGAGEEPSFVPTGPMVNSGR